jgi:hypothetical protein
MQSCLYVGGAFPRVCAFADPRRPGRCADDPDPARYRPANGIARLCPAAATTTTSGPGPAADASNATNATNATSGAAAPNSSELGGPLAGGNETAAAYPPPNATSAAAGGGDPGSSTSGGGGDGGWGGGWEPLGFATAGGEMAHFLAIVPFLPTV